MAATNPFRVSDLIAKYGWKVMPFLSNLGPQLLAEAQVLFVDYGHTNALDADDTEHGHSFEKPLATIDYAIDLCTAGERSVILVAPGHVDTLGDAQIDFDVSDITVIGIGEGSNKPKIVYGHANSSVDIGANNIHLINLRFVPSITDVLIGVDIETGKTGTILENCEFAEGDDIAADEFIIGLALKATCTDTRVKNCLFRTGLAADGATAAIQLTGISDNVVIEKSRFIGNWGTAAIYNDSGVCTDLLIDDCTMKVADSLPGISVVATTSGIIRDVCIESTSHTVDTLIVAAGMSWFNNYGVVADGTAAEIIGGGEVVASLIAYNLDHLALTLDDAGVYPTSVANDTILAKILSKDNPAAASSYSNITDSLEMTSDKLGVFSGDEGTAVDDNVKAALDYISKYLVDGDGDWAAGTVLPSDTSLYDTTKNVSEIGVTAAPTANTLSDILHKNGSFTYDNQSDSLEAIADKIIPSGANDVWFVDSDMGVDTGDGKSWATAKQLMTSAIALLTDGDFLYVRGTTAFAEAVTVPDGVDNCKIIGVSGSKRAPQWASSDDVLSALTINGEKNWEIYNMRFQGFAASTVACLHVIDGRGLVVENCYFHGGNNAHSAICLDGSCPQSRIENSFFHEFNTIAHGNSGNNFEATIWGTNYTQAAVGVDLINNHFTANLDDVKLMAHSCRIKDNTFSKYNPLQTTTTTLNLVCAGGVGGNIVTGNTFSDDSSALSDANGYHFNPTDVVAGNICPDGDSAGKPAGEAKAYYVDSDNGVDTNSGLSWGRAKLTIAAAVALVADYDTIYIRGVSVFAEDVTTTPGISNVKIIGVDNTKRRPDWRSTAIDAIALSIRSLDWEVHNIRFTGAAANTAPIVQVIYHSSYYGAGVLIKDCYFHGGGDSFMGLQFYGGGFQNDVIGCHFSDFGGASTGGQAALCTEHHDNYFLHAKIINNWFSENTNHLRINAQTCLIKGNHFQSQGAGTSATINCDVVNSGGAGCKGNCVNGNYFGDTKTNFTPANGYIGAAGDNWAGNYCLDGIDDGGVPA